ncbi:MAG: hypothetical protein QT00_C0001G0498 [archaeon GW2011_AR5]|nr:MAG: hypothetical protein QT00_C0001G0498 [archaeon GW2011_AR5]
MKCPHCTGRGVKRGLRRTNLGKKQLYLCTKCGRKFTTDWPKMRFHRSDVMHAVRLYKSGSSSSKVKRQLESRGVKVSRWTIIKWVRRFG